MAIDATTRDHTGVRLPPNDSQLIDRTRQVRFTFDGREVQAFAGDTIASALWATGQRTLSRSFKYHRPRGLLCASGDCPNCLVQVADEPNVRACRRPVEPGMRVRSQNRWPSLGWDAMRLVEAAERFLPPGFYYKTFMRPRALWPLYEELLRRAAGLGEVKPDSPAKLADHRHLHPDVTVVGAGPAGLAAARAAADAGARVVLIDENRQLGGHLCYRRPPSEDVEAWQRALDLIEAVEREPRVQVLRKTNAFGAYDHGWLGAASDDCLYKLRSRALVVASGTTELPMLFPGSDLPGVMLSGAAQRLLRLWAVKPGQRAVVAAPHRRGWRCALDLLEAGVEVAALVVPPGVPAQADEWEPLRARGVPVHLDSRVLRAEGGGQLEAVWLQTASGDGPQRVNCDLLVASAGFATASGLLYQAGAQLAWDEARGQHTPRQPPASLFAAGEVAGACGLGAVLDQGELAGLRAARQLGFGSTTERDRTRRLQAGLPADDSPSRRALPPDPGRDGKKRFVCYCEDVTRGDVRLAIEEGYESAELLKRYSTISMGPCQGRMCNHAAQHLAAHDTGADPAEIGKTTSRPPVRPVRLGTLAGPPMEPVRRTAMDGWHRGRGAKMMVAGRWMRPEHYGHPLEEVRAVRARVGLIDVGTLGKFFLHGPDVPELLERVYTNRWRKLDVGRVRYGVMVNEEGVVMDDGVTAHLDDDLYYMSATSTGAQAVHEWCEWWLQSGWELEVHMYDATEQRAAMNLTGPRAREVLSRVTAGVDLSDEAFPYMRVREAEVAGAPAILLRIGFTGELGYEIHTPSGYGLHVWRALMEAGEEFDIRPFGIEAQRVLRLEKGHLIVGQDTDSLSDAYEAGAGWAVKLDKGDFLGRPSLKLASERGPDRRLVGFEMPDGTVPEEANQIVRRGDGPIGLEIIGRVTSARWSPTLKKSIGLAWLPTDQSDVGTRFSVRVRGELTEGVVVDTPFYDPEGERLRS